MKTCKESVQELCKHLGSPSSLGADRMQNGKRGRERKRGCKSAKSGFLHCQKESEKTHSCRNMNPAWLTEGAAMTVLHHLHSSPVGLAVGWMSPLQNLRHYKGCSRLYADTQRAIPAAAGEQHSPVMSFLSWCWFCHFHLSLSTPWCPSPMGLVQPPVKPVPELCFEVGTLKSTQWQCKSQCHTDLYTQVWKVHSCHPVMASHTELASCWLCCHSCYAIICSWV